MQKNMEEKIDSIVESIKKLNAWAFSVYKPIVDDICSGRTVKEKELENVLDGLVSVCISDQMLGLFKQVCRKVLLSVSGDHNGLRYVLQRDV